MSQPNQDLRTAAEDLLAFVGHERFSTILADPPWQFSNRTGKMAPEHKRLSRYSTMTLQDIWELPIAQIVREPAHLYLWVPNALLAEGLEVMERWGFTYKTNIIWYKVRKDGGPDRRGVGFYFRNVTEMILFGVRGKNVRTLKAGRTQPNIIISRKREHSRKPDEQFGIIESCSWGPFLELFARHARPGWHQWGNEHLQEPQRELLSFEVADSYEVGEEIEEDEPEPEYKLTLEQLYLLETHGITTPLLRSAEELSRLER